MNATFGILATTRRERHVEFVRKISVAAFEVGLVLVEGVCNCERVTDGQAFSNISAGPPR
jgi:hypothetical protein